MTTYIRVPKAAALLAASAFLATVAPAVRAADPYDAALEKRIQALERELNLLSGDAKGKDVKPTEVPTFLRAAGKQVQELTLQGELRFRYQWDERERNDSQVGTTPRDQTIQSSRYRYRLRLNLNYKFSDNWFAGLGITSYSAADGNHQTITEGFDNSSIYLSLFFLGWKVNDNITLLGGKIIAPFYNNTDTIIDFGDIRPTGLTQRFNFDVNPQLNLKANFGQYAFYDNPENGGGYNGQVRSANGELVGGGNALRDGDLKTDAIFLYQDLILTYKPSNQFSAIVAPGFYTFVGGSGAGNTGGAAGAAVRNANASTNDASYNGTLLNTASFNDQNATRELYVGLLGTEANVSVPIGGNPVNVKFFGSAAYNFTGGARANDVYGIAEDSAGDKIAWAAGILIGELKKKGDFYITGNYAQVGIGSIDPNLNDPNFAFSRLNTQGFRLAAGYNFYSWLKGEVVYYNNWNLRENLHRTNDGGRLNVARGTPAAPQPGTFTNFTSLPFADLNSAQILQVQLTANF